MSGCTAIRWHSTRERVRGGSVLYDTIPSTGPYVDRRTDWQKCQAEITNRHLLAHVCDGATPVPRRSELPTVTDEEGVEHDRHQTIGVDVNGERTTTVCTEVEDAVGVSDTQTAYFCEEVPS